MGDRESNRKWEDEKGREIRWIEEGKEKKTRKRRKKAYLKNKAT